MYVNCNVLGEIRKLTYNPASFGALKGFKNL
jgi:hypothetical protein